jgi:hypothetical protein
VVVQNLSDVENNQRLCALYNIHQGKRCFVIGNGPSLRIADLDRLKGEITFASNKITLAFTETDWRPTYYTVCDAVVAEQNRNMILSLPFTKIFSSFVRRFFEGDPRAVFVNPPRSHDERRAVENERGIRFLPEHLERTTDAQKSLLRKVSDFWARHAVATAPDVAALMDSPLFPVDWNLLRGARAGHSVVNLGIKAAFWMGIREIYVIGVDHNFTVPPTHTGEVVANNEVLLSCGEVNHFHPQYRQPGEKWTMPKLDVIAEEFAYARRVLEWAGGTIKNASRFTKLEVWDRVDFDSLF